MDRQLRERGYKAIKNNGMTRSYSIAQETIFSKLINLNGKAYAKEYMFN